MESKEKKDEKTMETIKANVKKALEIIEKSKITSEKKEKKDGVKYNKSSI